MHIIPLLGVAAGFWMIRSSVHHFRQNLDTIAVIRAILGLYVLALTYEAITS